MLWSGDKAWRQSGERRMLCGLQLPGPNNQQLAFKGKVADVDQSKVWPAGTCLGIDPSTNQPTDIPVDCAARTPWRSPARSTWPRSSRPALPPEPEQDAFIKDACTRMTDAYLAPIQLRSTTLTLIYSTISLPSWSAGSHQVSCSIGATLGNGGWSTLLNSAKGPLMINGQPPIAPPDIPEDRLNLPPIPVIEPSNRPDIVSSQCSQSSQPPTRVSRRSTCQGNSRRARRRPRPPRPRRGAPPPQGNTFLNGPHRRPGRRWMGHRRPTVPPPPQGPAAPPGPAPAAASGRRRRRPVRRRLRRAELLAAPPSRSATAARPPPPPPPPGQ